MKHEFLEIITGQLDKCGPEIQEITTPIGVVEVDLHRWVLSYTSKSYEDIPSAILYLTRLHSDLTDFDAMTTGVVSSFKENGDIFHQISILQNF